MIVNIARGNVSSKDMIATRHYYACPFTARHKIHEAYHLNYPQCKPSMTPNSILAFLRVVTKIVTNRINLYFVTAHES